MSAVTPIPDVDDTHEDERVQLAKAACIFLGFDESEVTHKQPGEFLEAALDALAVDIDMMCAASSMADIGFSGPLHTLSRRLSTARRIGPMIERILAREAVQSLSKFEAEHEAAGHQVAATSVALRVAQIREAFPGLETEVQS